MWSAHLSEVDPIRVSQYAGPFLTERHNTQPQLKIVQTVEGLKKEMSWLWSWLTIDSHAAPSVLAPAVVPRGRPPQAPQRHCGLCADTGLLCLFVSKVEYPMSLTSHYNSSQHLNIQEPFPNILLLVQVKSCSCTISVLSRKNKRLLWLLIQEEA